MLDQRGSTVRVLTRVMPRRKSAQKVVVLVLLFTVFMEIGLRLMFGLGSPPLVVEHPQIEYLMRPNQDLMRFRNHIRINQFGMRSDDLDPEKKVNEFRVLVIGDSVVHGGALTSQGELATELLKENLRRTRHNPITVSNVSAGSWGPGNESAYLEEYGCFDADIIFIVLSSHDLRDIPTYAKLDPLTHPTQRPVSAIGECVTRYLIPWFSRPLQNSSRRRLSSAEQKERDKQSEEMLSQLLKTAVAGSQRVTIFLHAEESEVVRGDYVAAGHRIAELCAKLHVPCVQLLPYYKKAIDGGASIYRDHIHPNPAGQRVLYEVFREIIEEYAVRQ